MLRISIIVNEHLRHNKSSCSIDTRGIKRVETLEHVEVSDSDSRCWRSRLFSNVVTDFYGTSL